MSYTNKLDYAVVIGIKHYMSLNSLEGPINDATRFYNWLIDTNGGSIPPENCHLIPSDETVNPYSPLQHQVDSALVDIKRAGLETGFRRLYFYFSGHGIGSSWKDTGMCLPIYSNDYLNAALSSSEYLSFFVSSDLFEEVIFFLDCCRSRKVNAMPMPPMAGWAREGGNQCLRSMTFLATDFENPARESLMVKGDVLTVTGYFTEALIEGLNGAAADPDTGNITMSTLHNYVQQRTRELAAANNHSQEARLAIGELDNNFVIKPGVVVRPDVLIRFLQNGSYQLEDPSLNVIQSGEVAEGDTWTHSLKKGTYCILNLVTNDTKYLRVDGTKNPFNYEC
ncbi:caspase family protein [Dyadobacter sp. LHD-138]|uniref:caspase family protein n=1 Tax=Dyadobacter sp. LHD-138 TaxID=3071413 RepID=UPI0027DFCF69|nr:caspase family protein [Dyadobacter sp. LHD-138]MDQ6482416.1 caspase family protein [Dyadobacter sp. LHD-138]